MADYEKTFVVRISVDKNHLGSGFVYAHEGNWLSNSESEEDYYITPTDDELTDSIQSEILSWLEDLKFDVEVNTSVDFEKRAENLQLLIDILWDYVSEKDIPEISQRLEEE